VVAAERKDGDKAKKLRDHVTAEKSKI
jgi:hypothetical protein